MINDYNTQYVLDTYLAELLKAICRIVVLQRECWSSIGLQNNHNNLLRYLKKTPATSEDVT